MSHGDSLKPYYDSKGITIYHGDCCEVLPTLETGSVDLVLTDPPYGHNNNNNGDLIARREAALGRGDYVPGRDDRPIANDGEEASKLAQYLFAESARLLRPGCCCCCCCGGGPDPQFARWSLWMDAVLQFKMCVVWDKGGLGMGWHYRRNWECILVGVRPGAAVQWYGGNTVGNVISDVPKIIPRADQHPTVKPVELMRRFILWHTETDQIVVDPFCGAGTTAVAAKQENRRAIGIEIEERYCEVAAKRVEAAERGLTVQEVKQGQGSLFHVE